MNILLIEDDLITADLLERILHHESVHVHIAENLSQGMTLNQSILPELIVLDVGLPGSTHEEVIKSIPSMSEVNPTGSIMVYSGYLHDGRREACLEAGAHGVFEKPTASTKESFLSAILATFDNSDHTPQDILQKNIDLIEGMLGVKL